VLSLLAKYDCGSVLDLGCGNGVMVRRLIESGLRRSWVRAGRGGQAIARRNAGGARIYRLGVEDDPTSVDERPFDVVISTEVIEHLYDPTKLFQFARGVLKPDGHLLVSTPYHGYWKNLALSVADKWDFHHHPARFGGHIKFWSRKTLSEMFVNFGFMVGEFRAWPDAVAVEQHDSCGPDDLVAQRFPMSVPLSILIPIKNEAANLPRCLASVRWADEIWVVDSQSVDGSEESTDTLPMPE